MLRKIRIAAAAFFFVLTTLLFLDFTGTLHAWFGWMAKIQFPCPALLALNVGVVAFLVILTLLFGLRVLFGHLPAGGDAGHRFVGLREAQKAPEPLRVLPRPHLAAPGDARRVRRCDAGGCRFAARALQRLRPHRLEPAGPGLRVGATTCWHTSPGAWTATPSIRSTSG